MPEPVGWRATYKNGYQVLVDGNGQAQFHRDSGATVEPVYLAIHCEPVAWGVVGKVGVDRVTCNREEADRWEAEGWSLESLVFADATLNEDDPSAGERAPAAGGTDA